VASKKSKAELQAENQVLRAARRSDGVVSVLNNVVRWGGAVLISRYVFLAISSLSGETTVADIGIQFLGNLTVSETVAWIFGGSGVYYGLKHRKLRRDTAERLGSRNAKLEKRLDPQRRSSELTPRGETHPEDL
jgi:hypothetical protein